MEIDLFKIFSSNTVLVVFAAIAAGYLIGNTKIGRFQIGATGGVLISALFFGHFGFEIDPVVQSIGFTLFIYSVGWQAGPQILNVLGHDGPRYVMIALFIAGASLLLVFSLASVAELDSSLAAGLLAGALTSTPTLVGAQNAVNSGLLLDLNADSANTLIQNMAVGYAITYLFGTIGLLMLVKLLPWILRIDLVAEAKSFANERGFSETGATIKVERPILRSYVIEDERFIGKPLGQLREEFAQQYGRRRTVYRIKRGENLVEPTDEVILQNGDKIAVFGTPHEHEEWRRAFGQSKEALDSDLLDAVIDAAEIVVSNDDAIGRSLAEIGILENYGCFLSRITRSQVALPLTGEIRLKKGDVVTVSGERHMLDSLVARLGTEERTVTETDLVTFAAGIVLGLFIGQVTIKLAGIDVGIGDAGGLLLSGILVGFVRAQRPTFGRMPAAARFILMELGLMLFMVGVGLNAGGGIAAALGSVGLELFLCGVLVTCVPLLFGYAFGRLVLRMNPAVLLGALTGAMTSTPALGLVQQAAKSTVPALGYAGTYALANVLLTLAGTMIILLF